MIRNEIELGLLDWPSSHLLRAGKVSAAVEGNFHAAFVSVHKINFPCYRHQISFTLANNFSRQFFQAQFLKSPYSDLFHVGKMDSLRKTDLETKVTY